MFEEKSIKIKLNKEMILSEIETQLLDKFVYKNISIAIKKTLRNGIIKPDIINLREEVKTRKNSSEIKEKEANEQTTESTLEMKNQNKTFGNLCVTPQFLLFIDDSESTKSRWADYFKKENNMIVINFNYPLEENQTIDNIDYCFRLKVDLRQPLLNLKETLETYVHGLDVEKYKPKNIKILNNSIDKNKNDEDNGDKKEEEKVIHNETLRKLIEHQRSIKVMNTKNLILKKGGKSGIELKDLNKTLRRIGFINNSYVFLRFGRKATPGEIKVNLFFCLNSLNSNEFNLKRQIEYFGETYILSKLTASKVIDQLKNEYPVLKSKQILLREKDTDVLTKVFRNYSLRGQYVYDRKNLVIEESTLGIPQKDEVFIYYTVLKHDESSEEVEDIELDIVRQMVVNKQNNLREMGEMILEDFRKKNEMIAGDKVGKSGVSFYLENGVENMTCTKIRDVANFIPMDILGHKFFKLFRNDQVVSSSPFYLENDGCLFILKKKGVGFSNKLRQKMKRVLPKNNGFFENGGEQNLQIFIKKKS